MSPRSSTRAAHVVAITLVAVTLAWALRGREESHLLVEIALAAGVVLVEAFAWFAVDRRAPAVDAELDAAILRARVGLEEVGRVDLRRELDPMTTGLDRRAAADALAGLAATLGLLHPEDESADIASPAFPFPWQVERDALVATIVFSSGVPRARAAAFLDALVDAILARLARARASRAGAIELFPLGLYERLGESAADRARFSPQRLVLPRLYPGLAEAVFEADALAQGQLAT